jgi:hypothetical protein
MALVQWLADGLDYETCLAWAHAIRVRRGTELAVAPGLRTSNFVYTLCGYRMVLGS